MNEDQLAAASEQLRSFYTGVARDVVRAVGVRDFVLPPEIRPIGPEVAIVGPAFTIEGQVRADADGHEMLLAWTGLLSQRPVVRIWASQPNDRAAAHIGELSVEALKNKGVLGCVVDRFVRDANFLLDVGFQLWRRGFTLQDAVAHWLFGAVNVPIKFGDVVTEPSDCLVGDRDGTIRVAKAHVLDVIEKCEVAMATGSKLHKAIPNGVDPRQAYLSYGKF